MDCMARAVEVVATALPRATPMIVPFSPNNDAMTAEATAPAAEAATCLALSLIDSGPESHRPRCREAKVERATIPWPPSRTPGRRGLERRSGTDRKG